MSAKISRSKRSPVWAYFEGNGPKSVVCNACGAKLARQSGTTNLFNHLKTHHREKYLEVVGVKSQAPEDVAVAASPKTAAGTKPLQTFFSSSRACDVLEQATYVSYTCHPR